MAIHQRIFQFLYGAVAVVTVLPWLFRRQASGFEPRQRRRSFPHSPVPRKSQLSLNIIINNNDNAAAAQAALQRTAAHLEKLQSHQPSSRGRNRQIEPAVGSSYRDKYDDSEKDEVDGSLDPLGEEREKLYREYLRWPANALKVELQRHQLLSKGRKPDLAQRLVQHELQLKYGTVRTGKEPDFDWDQGDDQNDYDLNDDLLQEQIRVSRFAGLKLSESSSLVLGRAGFVRPSPIQAVAIPAIARGQSCLLHAVTGSGKTLAYILPVIEQLLKLGRKDGNIALILTPTRELAAQVAGIASVLLPGGAVKLVSRPCNLMADRNTPIRMYVGSAKAVQQSLYGDGKMPAPPTSKPEAMALLQKVGWIVLDEVDRLLGVAGSSKRSSTGKKHEKPAAILVAAVARLTLGKAVTIGASATVGRPLKRELARCLGLPPNECPQVLRASGDDDDDDEETPSSSTVVTAKQSRIVTIPDTVRHCVVPVDGSSPGKLLTKAFEVVQALNKDKNGNNKNRKLLLVLARNFGISTANSIGALKHFGCQPEPVSLLDALDEVDGIDNFDNNIMELHRQVTGVGAVGESSGPENSGYLLVTGEDTVRGLHFDKLDAVIVVGRTHGPDEYSHVCGRTGRAGATGACINVVADVDTTKLASWESMLRVKFEMCVTVDDCVAWLDSR